MGGGGEEEVEEEEEEALYYVFKCVILWTNVYQLGFRKTSLEVPRRNRGTMNWEI